MYVLSKTYYQANNGRFSIIAFTFLRVSAINSSLLTSERTWSIISTIASISSSFKPLVVIAGVPTRIPEVWNGCRMEPCFC